MATAIATKQPKSNDAKSSESFNTSEELYYWLSSWPAISAQLKLVVIGLRRRQLSGAHPCAKATIEILRSLLGTVKFQNTYSMMCAVKALGRELVDAAPSELSSGNIVRRVLFLIREEYNQKMRSASPIESNSNTSKANRPRGNSTISNETTRSPSGSIGGRDRDDEYYTATSTSTSFAHPSIHPTGSTPGGSGPAGRAVPRHSAGRGNMDGNLNGEVLPIQAEETYYSRSFPDMRQSLMAAVIELNEEIDNVHAPICEQAQEHIHNDECVLVFGYSSTLEYFLKAAARKRRFQVVIAEASPTLEGHKLASSLSKITGGNISVTLIPDSAIYAIMSRINKVLVSPHAVIADGGSICASGNLMVATAAKEFSVPVIGLVGAFMLAPLFAHNQTEALGQLLSPASAIAYNAPVDFQNVEVIVPAFDYIPPSFMDIYVTSSGSHQPSYIYRLLAEYYHPNDHLL